jgi:hypothetical protein
MKSKYVRRFVLEPYQKQMHTNYDAIEVDSRDLSFLKDTGKLVVVLESDYKTLRSHLDLAVKAIRFYADRKNWNDRAYESPDGNSDNDGDIFDVIDIEDVEIAVDDKHNDESYIGHYTFGGKLARATLKQLTQGEE